MKEKNNFIYSIKSFMKDVLELDEDYINEIYSYYENSLTYYTLKSDINSISGYRKKLLKIYTEDIRVNDIGEQIKFDKSFNKNIHKLKSNKKSIEDIVLDLNDYDLMGTIIFSILQYEEDTRIENYDELYDFDKFDHKEFRKALQNKIKNNENETDPNTNIKSIINDGKVYRNKENNSCIILNNKELLYDFYYSKNKYYVCLSEWDGKYIATRFRIPLENPFAEKSLEYFENKNSVKIIKEGKITKTLNDSSILVFDEKSWIAI